MGRSTDQVAPIPVQLGLEHFQGYHTLAILVFCMGMLQRCICGCLSVKEGHQRLIHSPSVTTGVFMGCSTPHPGPEYYFHPPPQLNNQSLLLHISGTFCLGYHCYSFREALPLNWNCPKRQQNKYTEYSTHQRSVCVSDNVPCLTLCPFGSSGY